MLLPLLLALAGSDPIVYTIRAALPETHVAQVLARGSRLRTATSRTRALLIPADEELMLARHTRRLVAG